MTGTKVTQNSLNLTPEERLLLACALPPERHDPESLARHASEVSDWQGFTEKALKAKFAPLVFARLSELNLKGTLPKPLFMRLAAAQVAADGANRRLLAERDRLMAMFAEAGVSALPLKGCALADTLYGDPSLRPMGDLDLLFREEEFGAAVSLLQNSGYRTDGIDPRGETFFYHPDDHLFIDAHTALDPSGRFRISTEELWADAAPLPAVPSLKESHPSTGMKTLSVQHHLVHGLLHAARHRLDSLGPLVDATWIAARWPEEVHWETLSDLARRWQCREALGFALHAASLLFGLTIPDNARQPLELKGWRRPLLSRLWPGDAPLQSIESRSRSARYVFSALTTSWPGGFIGATNRFGALKPVDRGKPDTSPT